MKRYLRELLFDVLLLATPFLIYGMLTCAKASKLGYDPTAGRFSRRRRVQQWRRRHQGRT
jgi:hypothetical protein